MTDSYYGYTPVSLPYEVAQYDDYAAGSPTPDYTPTDWNNYDRTNIDSMWEWIQPESNERVTAVADMWRRVVTLLDLTASNLRMYADALSAKWNSDAGKMFMQQVGKALYSMDQWREVAMNNASGLDLIAGAIVKNQWQAKKVFEEYVQAYTHPGSVPGSAAKILAAGRGGVLYEKEDDRKQRMRKAYTPLIQPFVKDVADTYMDVFFNNLGRGDMYKGPTDAVYTSQDKLTPKPGSLGGGGIPPVPNVSALLASIHQQIKVPPLPQPSTPPGSDLTLAGVQTAPPLPHAPLPGAGLPTPQLPNPNLPVPGVPGLPPILTGDVEVPPRAGLPGAGVAPEETGFGRPSLPGKPNLSGLRKPGSPGRPPSPGRGNPNLRGSKARPGSLPEGSGLDEQLEHPNARGPLPPRLNGRRPGGNRPGTGAPGEEQSLHGGSPRGGRPGGEPGERLTGRRQPGLPEEEQDAFRRGTPGRPDLGGRSTPRRRPGEPDESERGRSMRGQGGAESEEPGQGRVLRGRGTGEGEQPGRGLPPGGRGTQRKKDKRESAEVGPVPEGDDALWSVEQAAPAVIDTPEPVRPAEPGQALGRATG